MFSHTTCPETIGKSRPHAIKARVAGKTFLQILFFFLLVTQIGFAQWYQQNTGTTQNLYAVHFTDANNGFAVGDSGTIIQTNDGGATWANQTSGTILMLRDIFFVSSRNGWAVGYDLDYHSVVLHTTNGGIVWKTQWEQQNVWLLESVFFVDSLTGWIVGDSLVGIYEVKSSIWKTSDGGFNWLRQYEGELHTKMTSVFFIDSLNGWAGGIAYSSGVQPPLLKTTNSGVNWNYMTNVPQYTDAYSIHFTNINNGWIVGEPNVTQTTDGGDSWIKNDSILGMRGGDISVYFTDLHNGWIVGCSALGTYIRAYITHTTNSGKNWTTESFETGIGLFDVYFVDSLTGWVAGNNGLILHTTNGDVPVELTSFTATANGKEVKLNWSTATELNNQGFEVQRKFGPNDFVTIGSVKGHGTTTSPNQYTFIDKILNAGKYFYRLKQIDYGGKCEYSQTVEVNWSPLTTYKLEQNYPNPFNPSTKISWQSPVSSRQVVKVFDVLGNEIKTLVNEEMEAGYHSIDFNGSDLPSGVYFYQLKAGQFIETKKMILLR